MKSAACFLEYYRKIRFIFLFFFLLLSIGLIPLLSEWGFGYAAEIIPVFLALILLASLITIVGHRLLLVLLVILFLVVVIKLLYLLLHFNVMLPTSQGLQGVFLFDSGCSDFTLCHAGETGQCRCCFCCLKRLSFIWFHFWFHLF